ncbi:protease inhibitor I42 family protein [Sporomusa malonica]|uniref:Predicted secreted protein n=1 Tax=Sporomusa malonica TaxID=112901 RepID=A0A1W2ESU1_9FIRM|nr:protease inhibitor I42 family protein [Sporomusa malonica]SMD12783.1 Predicted secreted protein [Sporomusa malonica]
MKIPYGEMLKKVFAMLSMSFLIWGMAAAGVLAEDMTVREPPIAMTVKADADDAASEGLAVDIKAGDFFKVELYAASGTGYDWELLNKALQLVKVEKRYSVMETPNLPGGKMCTVYILQAKPDTVGQEPVVFSLRRSWEPANMAAKTINCEVKVSKE